MGDFNEILMNEEKKGGVNRSQGCLDQFRDALEECKLSDLGYEGDMITWWNNCTNAEGYICGRLDRAVANMEWCSTYPEFRVRNELPRHSYHRPVVVDTEDMGERREREEEEEHLGSKLDGSRRRGVIWSLRKHGEGFERAMCLM